MIKKFEEFINEDLTEKTFIVYDKDRDHRKDKIVIKAPSYELANAFLQIHELTNYWNTGGLRSANFTSAEIKKLGITVDKKDFEEEFKKCIEAAKKAKADYKPILKKYRIEDE
jgi:hypothetical protein